MLIRFITKFILSGQLTNIYIDYNYFFKSRAAGLQSPTGNVQVILYFKKVVIISLARFIHLLYDENTLPKATVDKIVSSILPKNAIVPKGSYKSDNLKK